MVSSDLRRQSIWQWECHSDECSKKRRSNRVPFIKNSMSASAHAEAHPGHVVTITYGDRSEKIPTLYKTLCSEARPDYTQEANF